MQPETQNEPSTPPSFQPNPPLNEPPVDLSPTPEQPKSKKKLFIILGVCTVVLIAIIIGIIVALVNGHNKSSGVQTQNGAPANVLTIGNNPYIYACDVMHRDDIATVSPLASTMIGEAILSTQAIPYEAVSDKKYDLTTATVQSYGLDYITSECQFVVDTGSIRKQIDLKVNQYPTVAEAALRFKQAKQYAGSTPPLTSFKDTSYVEKAMEKYSPDELDSATVQLLNKNATVEIDYQMGDVTADTAGQKLDPFAKKLVQNMNEAAKTVQPYNFTGISSIGNTKFIDACHALDFGKAAIALGGIDYERVGVKGDNSYGRFDATGDTIGSTCQAKFRNPEDKDKFPVAQKGKSISLMDETKRYPDGIELDVSSYADNATAVAALTKEKQGLPNKTLLKQRDFQFGDTSLSYDQSTSFSDSVTARRVYKFVKGSSIVQLFIDQDTFTTPFVPTVKTISDDQAKTILSSLRL